MNITAIWNTLKAEGKYTPEWTPGQEAENLQAAKVVCEQLATSSKTDKMGITTYKREGIKFMIYSTYNFEDFRSSEESGFRDTHHYIIRTHRF